MILLKNLMVLQSEFPISWGAYTIVRVDGNVRLDLGDIAIVVRAS